MALSMRLSKVLVDAGLLDAAQAEKLERQTAASQKSLIDLMVEARISTDVEIANAIAVQTGVPIVLTNQISISGYIAKLLPKEYADKWAAIPISSRKEGDQEFLYVAFSDPTDPQILIQAEQITHRKVKTVVSPISQIRQAISRYLVPIKGRRSSTTMTAIPAQPAEPALVQSPPQIVPPEPPPTRPSRIVPSVEPAVTAATPPRPVAPPPAPEQPDDWSDFQDNSAQPDARDVGIDETSIQRRATVDLLTAEEEFEIEIEEVREIPKNAQVAQAVPPKPAAVPEAPTPPIPSAPKKEENTENEITSNLVFVDDDEFLNLNLDSDETGSKPDSPKADPKPAKKKEGFDLDLFAARIAAMKPQKEIEAVESFNDFESDLDEKELAPPQTAETPKKDAVLADDASLFDIDFTSEEIEEKPSPLRPAANQAPIAKAEPSPEIVRSEPPRQTEAPRVEAAPTPLPVVEEKKPEPAGEDEFDLTFDIPEAPEFSAPSQPEQDLFILHPTASPIRPNSVSNPGISPMSRHREIFSLEMDEEIEAPPPADKATEEDWSLDLDTLADLPQADAQPSERTGASYEKAVSELDRLIGAESPIEPVPIQLQMDLVARLVEMTKDPQEDITSEDVEFIFNFLNGKSTSTRDPNIRRLNAVLSALTRTAIHTGTAEEPDFVKAFFEARYRDSQD